MASYVLITPDKITKAENWSAHYGAAGVFVARLLPGARQLVGIPAGIAKFDYLKFSIFTLAGSAIWCSVLCWLGVKIGADVTREAKFRTASHALGRRPVAVVSWADFIYFFVHRHMVKESHKEPEVGR